MRWVKTQEALSCSREDLAVRVARRTDHDMIEIIICDDSTANDEVEGEIARG